MAGPKVAFQPLLPPGRHVMTVDRLRDLTVTRFIGSARRPILFAELERLVSDLLALRVVCELWVDGSFLTEKDEPDDIDLSFSAWAHHVQSLPPVIQNFILIELNGGKKYSPALDTYVCFRFLREDPRRAADTTDYWTEKWGIGWDDRLKGYAVIRIGESDVGRKICA